MPGPLRYSRLLGALIATAVTLYAATKASGPEAGVKRAGRRAALPPPRPSWGKILSRVWDEINNDHVSMMAAGVAFYGLLAIFPGMSALISIYGLVADPAVIESHLEVLAGVLPTEALKLISDQLHALVTAPPAKLGIGLIVSLMVALWSATSGTSMLMQTLTLAYEETDDRGILHFYALAIALTIGIVLFGLFSLFLIAVVPVALDWLPLPEVWRDTAALIRWPLLAIVVLVGLSLLYRLAPRRHQSRWHWLSLGTVAAAGLWLLGSAGFSLYVARFNSYDKTYGSIGAVVVLLMWFYVSAFIVLAGAELNSELEGTRPRRRPPASAPQPLPFEVLGSTQPKSKSSDSKSAQ